MKALETLLERRDITISKEAVKVICKQIISELKRNLDNKTAEPEDMLGINTGLRLSIEIVKKHRNSFVKYAKMKSEKN